MATKVIDVIVVQQDLEAIVVFEKPLEAIIDIDLSEQEELVAQGWIKVSDVTPQTAGQSVTSKVYQDTAQTILQSAEASEYILDFLVRSSFPLVDVNGTQYELAEVTDQGHYEGTVSVTLDDQAASNIYDVEAKAVTPDDLDGAVDTVEITVTAPPQILTMSFIGGYPGSQTQLKAGDTFQITGTLDRAADAIDIQDLGACDASLEVITIGVSFTVTGTIADRGTSTQALAASCRARDAITGGLGPVRSTNELAGGVDGTDLVDLNNTLPSVVYGTITYPASQQALKGSEAAVVPITLADFDSFVYMSPTAELSIDAGTSSQIDVSRIGGTYNVSTNNLRATVTRNANDAVTIEEIVVNIAHVAANASIALPAVRLRSGGSDGTVAQDHTITLTSTQQLLSITTDPDSGGSRGAFVDSWTPTGSVIYDRTLRVLDSDEKGVFTWSNVLATNLAGITTSFLSAGTTYTLGGFVARTLTYASFATQAAMNAEVVDFSKLQAGIFTSVNKTASKQAISTPPSVTDGYTIDSLGVNPTQVIWLDSAAAGANSTGTAQITDVEEIV